MSSRSSRDFQASEPARAQGLADDAGGAGEAAGTVSSMTDAVLGRHVVSQAVGIVMERFQLTSTRAYEYLVRTSRTSQCSLRVVAAEVVTRANERGDPGRQA
jgi:hypothetical protein